MMNAPTNRDTSANAISTVLKVLMACSKMSWFSLVNAAPVITCVSVGRPDGEMRDTSSCWETPGSAATAM